MSIAVAETLLAHDAPGPEELAEGFVEAFNRDPRDGYARGFHGLLRQVRTGTELRTRIDPRSDRSGAAMRAGPIGLLADHDRVLRTAAVQARITHDTRDGSGQREVGRRARCQLVLVLFPTAPSRTGRDRFRSTG